MFRKIKNQFSIENVILNEMGKQEVLAIIMIVLTTFCKRNPLNFH